MGSHEPSSEDLSPFLESGCCTCMQGAEDSSHISMQHKITSVLAGVTVL